MTPEQKNRVRELFLAACEKEPDDRPDFLRRMCADDDVLRREVESLLANDDEGDTFLSSPALGDTFAAASPESLLSGSSSRSTDGGGPGGSDPSAVPTTALAQIGQYRITGVLGRGGMGVVYRARQEHPRRDVALKVIRGGVDSREMLARFQHECQVLGCLQHAGIAQVYEAGTEQTQSGPQPFFAMELVNGQPLTQYAEANRLSTRQRLELIARVCDAVHHAHQKGVIHRDIKPGNILVDESGQPKILDFGVARVTDADIRTTTLQTRAGQLVGTIAYMSPEQVSGDSRDLDIRSDVYSLGAVCYELLTGRQPLDVSRLTIPQAARVIAEEEPTSLTVIDRSYQGDVETIVSKALEKEKERRYTSASDLAADIRRFLADEPISARPATTIYQLRKFTRRNKALVGGAVATFLALIVGIVGISIQAARVTRERNHAKEAEGLADERRVLAERRAYAANIAAAHAALRAHDAAIGRQRIEAAMPSLRNWEWRYLASRLDTSMATLVSHTDYVWSAEFAPDGRSIMSTSADGTVKLWNASSFEVLKTFAIDGGSSKSAVFSPDGKHVVIATRDGTPKVLDLESEEIRLELVGHTNEVVDASYSADRTLIATASNDCTVRVWDAAGGELVATFQHPHRVFDVCFALDSSKVATSCRDNVARIWDLTTHSLTVEVRVHPTTVEWDMIHPWGVALSSDGRILATGGHDDVIRLWRTQDGDLTESLVGHTERVRSLAYSPDGSLLASASDDGTCRVWQLEAGKESSVLLGHAGSVFSVSFSPDGRRLATASADHTIRIWDAKPTETADQIRGHGRRNIRAIDISLDGKRIVTAGENETLGLWDIETGASLGVDREHENWIYTVEFSPDGTRTVSGSRDGTLRMWNLEDGVPSELLGRHKGSVRAAVFLDGGARVASASMDGVIKIWDLATRDEIQRLVSEGEELTALAHSPDGKQLACGTSKGDLHVWDIKRARRVSFPHGHADWVWDLSYNSDGSLLLSASQDNSLKLWSTRTGQLVTTLRGHAAAVTAATFSPDGSRIASVSHDRTLRLWDPITAEAVLSFKAHRDWPFAVEFSPDGATLVTAARTFRLWRADW